ncbi:hypothetical protein KC352_g58 [Hortaea werneckii]|nr:hypothetical protein KC352_g58 [Hortaea werneckii]
MERPVESFTQGSHLSLTRLTSYVRVFGRADSTDPVAATHVTFSTRLDGLVTEWRPRRQQRQELLLKRGQDDPEALSIFSTLRHSFWTRHSRKKRRTTGSLSRVP